MEHRVLHPGDSLELTVTHQIRINGDDSWIKYGVRTTVQDGENSEEVAQEVLNHVDAFVVEACEQVAKTVERYQ
jgi:hypothetical protein